MFECLLKLKLDHGYDINKFFLYFKLVNLDNLYGFKIKLKSNEEYFGYVYNDNEIIVRIENCSSINEEDSKLQSINDQLIKDILINHEEEFDIFKLLGENCAEQFNKMD